MSVFYNLVFLFATSWFIDLSLTDWKALPSGCEDVHKHSIEPLQVQGVLPISSMWITVTVLSAISSGLLSAV